MGVCATRQRFVYFSSTYCGWLVTCYVDPPQNSARRAAAKAWNEFSDRTTSVIPLSVIRNDKRSERAEKGEVSARVFRVAEVEDLDNGVDGCERPDSSNFSLGKLCHVIDRSKLTNRRPV